MDNKLIGEQITRYRKEKNLTQEELGRAAGVSTQAVSRWENGGAPDVALLPAIADKLGVTIDALFGRDGGERVDIRETMLQWARTLPKGKRLDQFCRLVWSLLIRGGLTETELPKIDYPAQGKLEGDGRLLLSCGIRLKNNWGIGVAQSRDQGASWSWLAGLCNFGQASDGGYPASVQLADGSILTHYYISGVPFCERYFVGQVHWELDELF